MINTTRPVVRRTLGAAASAGLVITLLAACGGGSTAAASSSGSTGATSGTTGQNPNRGFPGVNGQIAAVSGKTLQVQSTSSQTAVTYTDSTKLTQVVTAAESDLAVGKCVSVRPVMSSTPAAGTTAPDPSIPIVASSVSISDPVNGVCGRAGGFGGGRRGAGQIGRTGAPANPTGGPRGGFGGGASGTIASISGDTMTVTSTRPAAAAGSTTSGATTTTVTRTVTLDSATTYTKTEPADASALTVGKCVTALGTTDSTGAMTAGSINIRPAVDGTCSMGFGRGQGNGANAATGATTQAG